jgi:glycine cleavage system transcriptional repressor
MSDGNLIAVSAIGRDRPGIAAGVTKVLFDAGANLEDATSTILRGHFTMTLIVRTPTEVTADRLESDLEAVAREMGLVVSARPVDEGSSAIDEPTHMVSVYGADRPGIVYRVTETLARLGCNVTDFTSRMIGDTAAPVYALLLEVSTENPAALAGELDELRGELEVDISVHPIDADVF